MGQTLTHGIYLPDEGERNCYSGLAANWQILDNSVGTIAAHTASLAGKAPLVHTHTKSDITDFPAYGNAAGTICEGNDSRLSDARTPVAHTHTKSDVTDLFNSANTWTASNTYSNGQLRIKAISQEIGVIPTSDRVQFVSFNDKNDEQIGIIGVWYNNSGRTEMKLYVSDKYKDGVKDPTGTKTTETLSFGMASDGNKFFAFEGKLGTSLYPFTTNFYNIGSSDNQWNNLYAKRVNTQSLNGVNPGALSLLDYSKAESLDVSAQGLNWDLTGATSNSYTPTFDGYLSLRCKDTNGDFLFAAYGGSNAIIRNCAVGTGILPGNAGLCLLIPMLANTSISIQAKATANFRAYIIPCFGNV